jgi:hypothetical protein
MFEGFKSTPPSQENNENLNEWRERKESAPQEVLTLLAERGLMTEFESASPEELQVLAEQLQSLINELSVDESGEVRNENRYLVRELSIFQNQVEQYQNYKNTPTPAFRSLAQ